MAQLPPPTGVTARYQGPGSSNFTTTFYYWIQAVYPDGNSLLSVPANTGAYCPASLFGSGFVAVQWNPMPGAIGYYIYRNTTGTTPQNGATAIFIATSETGFKDDGTYPTFTKIPHYDNIYTARMLWNFSVDGGSDAAAIIPSISDTIPLGALVIGGVWITVTTIVGPTNIEFGTSAGSSATSIMAGAAISGFPSGTVTELLGINSQAATHKPSFQMSAAGQLTLTFTAANATAGCVEVIVFYVMPSNL